MAPDETVYIINLTGTEAQKVKEITSDSMETPFETSIACIGASTCQAGIRDSQALLGKAVKAVRDAKLPADALPRIHISGCPSSCGTHQVGEIGFRGGVKMIDKKPFPVFEVYIFGCDRQGEERLGESAGTMLEEKIPVFLVELGRNVADSGLTYSQWTEKNQETLRTIVKKYTAV